MGMGQSLWAAGQATRSIEIVTSPLHGSAVVVLNGVSRFANSCLSGIVNNVVDKKSE